MSVDENVKDDPAPLNILEYTFAEKMLFVNTVQLKKLAKVFPKIQKKDIKPFALLSLKEIEGQTPRIGGIADIMQYVAIRSLVHILYREANLSNKHKPPPDEMYEYLLSLNLTPECSRELLNLLLTPTLFSNVPNAVRLHPTIVSTRWMIDLSYCQRDPNHFADDTGLSKIDKLRQKINVILMLQFSNGQQKVIGVRWHELSQLRLNLAEILQSVEETEDTLRAKEKTDRENLLIMKSEGHF